MKGSAWGTILLIVICLLSTCGLIISSILAFSFFQTSRTRDTQLASLEETQEVLGTQAAELQILLDEEERARSTAEALSEYYMGSAERYASTSEGNRLAAEAIGVYEKSPPLGLLLAIEAVNSTLESDGMPSTKAEEALRTVLSNSGGLSLVGHDQAINDIRISPDNRWLISASRDGTIQVWDRTSENPTIATYRLNCLGEIQNFVEISPDSGWLISGGEHGSLCIWNLNQDPINLDPIILEGHQGHLQTLKFSLYRNSFFTSDSNASFRIWNLMDQAAISDVFEYTLSGKTISDVDISEDFGHIAVTTYEGEIYLIDVVPTEPSLIPLDCPIETPYIVTISSIHSFAMVAGGKKVCVFNLHDLDAPPILLSDHEEYIQGLTLSPDGQWLITTSGDNLGYLWTMQDLTQSPQLLNRHERPIIDIAFTSDSQQLITAGGDGKIFILDLSSSDPILDPKLLLGHDDPIYSIDISADSQWLVSGGYTGVIRLWTLASPMGDPWIITKYKSRSLAISPDSQWLVTSHDTFLQIWDLTQSTTSSRQYEGFENTILSADFSSNGEILAAGSWDETVHYWDPFNPDLLMAPTIIEAENGITLVGVSPSGRWLLYNVGDRTDAFIIDLQSQDRVLIPLLGIPYDTSSAAFSPNEEWLVVGSSHGPILLWDLTLQDPFSQSNTIGSVRLGADELIFSNDGQFLIAQERDTLLFWDLSKENPSWEPKKIEGHVEHLADIDISHDNQWIAAASIYGPITMWNIQDMSTVRYTMNHDSVNRIDFSPDGHWLASGGQDDLVRLWNLHSENPALSPIILEGHEDMIYDLVFTPDGNWLISVSSDSVRAWSMSLDTLLTKACTFAGRNLTFEEWQVYLGEEPYRISCTQYPAAVPVSYEPTPIP